MSRSIQITCDGGGRYVFSVEDIEPPARYGNSELDTGPWVTIRVKESERFDAAWDADALIIGSTEILPVDADPARPEQISVTVAGANLQVGWYVFELLDEDGNIQPIAPVHSGQSWRPGQRDVARQLRNRTFAGGGRIPGFLNDDDEGGPTDPTKDEVERLIDDAMSDIASKVGVRLPDAAFSIARRVAILGIALLVEIGSEDFDQERYDRLQILYDARLTQLLEAAQDVATGGEVGDADDRPLAVGSFPAAGSCVPGSEGSWDVIGKTGIWDC